MLERYDNPAEQNSGAHRRKDVEIQADSFFAIPAHIASTILAVGNVIRQVFPRKGQITVRKMMSLSVAIDRMVSDEIYAAKFLSFIIEQLQNPQHLI